MKRRRFLSASLTILPLTLAAGVNPEIPARTSKGYKVNSGEARFGEHFNMKAITQNTLDIKISGNDTNGELAVFEQTGHTPKSGPPLHIHFNQDEWFYILEGAYIFQVGELRYPMNTGDTIFLPRNIPHGFIQISEKARVIVSFLPAGKIEAFFKLTDSWESPPSREEIKKAFEDNDMQIAGPPIKAE